MTTSMSGPVTKDVRVQAALGGKGSFSDKKPETETLAGGNGKKQATILFVDDDPLIPRSIVRAISGSYETRIFNNPYEALESYKSGPVDLVVSDYHMKCDMDGLGLLQALRTHDPAAKVVVLSGGLGQKQMDDLFTFGAQYVLPKPFDLTLFKLAISNAIGNKIMAPSRLLIVDDHENTSTALARLLESEHKRVDTAENGLDGYAKYSAGGFDLVISDLNMPVMGGLDLLRMIRQGNPAAKMIIMSGGCSEEEKRALYDSGAVAVLEKPINIELLRVSMVAALG